MLTATDRVLCFGLHSLYRATTEMQYLLRHGDTSCLGWIGWIGVCELPPIRKLEADLIFRSNLGAGAGPLRCDAKRICAVLLLNNSGQNLSAFTDTVCSNQWVTDIS